MARRRLCRVEMTVVGVTLAGFLGAVSAAAQEATFTVSGTSTVRAWSCAARGAVKLTPGKSAPSAPGFPTGLQSLTVTVPLSSFECENPEMTEHLRDALKAKIFPEITYQLDQYSVAGDVAKTTGRLRITGVTKPVAFEVKLTQASEGVRGVGETSLDMTEFGVTPPSLWGNLLRVGKLVRIKFDVVLRP